MKQLRYILGFVLVLAGTSVSPAGGPLYSRFALGDLRYFGSNRASAMGLLGIALTGDGFINSFNPAGLSKISLTRISAGFEFARTISTDQTGSTTFGHGDFQNIALAIPASIEDGIVFYAGISPYSLVNYKVNVVGATPGIPSTQKLSGNGGLSSLSLGASYSPRSDLSLGLKYSYLYGTIAQIVDVSFDDPSFASSELQRSLFHSGSMATFGLQSNSLGDLLNLAFLKPVSFGFVLTTPASLSAKEENLFLTSTTADTVTNIHGTTKIPVGYGLGASYSASKRLLVGADVFLQQWASANFFGTAPVSTRNSLRAALGLELSPVNDPSTYWERVAYRAGFAYNESYLSVNGQPLNEWYVTGGVGLPIGPDARLNLALALGSRGTTAQGLQKDNFVRLSLSFNASEKWFIRIEED